MAGKSIKSLDQRTAQAGRRRGDVGAGRGSHEVGAIYPGVVWAVETPAEGGAPGSAGYHVRLIEADGTAMEEPEWRRVFPLLEGAVLEEGARVLLLFSPGEEGAPAILLSGAGGGTLGDGVYVITSRLGLVG